MKEAEMHTSARGAKYTQKTEASDQRTVFFFGGGKVMDLLRRGRVASEHNA